MKMHSNDSKVASGPIVEAISSHLEHGLAADWRPRCNHFVAALRLLKQHAAAETTGSISKDHRQRLDRLFLKVQKALASQNSVGSPLDSDRMFSAINYLVRTWAQPRHPTAPIPLEGAILQAGILCNMLETALTFYSLTLWDHELFVELTDARTALLRSFLDTSAFDQDQVGGGT